VRLAVISDIHANLEAFRSVLADIDAVRADGIVCLGDIIGYGPRPEECIRLVRDRAIPSVLGNHELGLVRSRKLSWFNPTSRACLVATGKLLSPESLDWMKTLPASLTVHGARFVHGCPPDSPLTYLFELSEDGLREVFETTRDRLAFAGHTHDLELISWDGHEVCRSLLGRGERLLEPDLRYIVNVGSVGQPRDGDHHAKYVVWDSARDVLDIRFVAYDIDTTVREILALGFPEQYARRLR
jgi:diadenosine tetraphosphatase ApaH/serine/threonine PP2A family protein phosphatase